jgi:hypothetical protein
MAIKRNLISFKLSYNTSSLIDFSVILLKLPP